MTRLLPFAAALCGTVLVSAQNRPFWSPQEPLALVNAHVVNVVDGTIRRNTTILLRDGRIESLTDSAPEDRRTRVVNLAGRYVVPGLIDAHVHITTVSALRAALESGVTTARSSGVSSYVDVGMRELVKQGALTGPEVVASGYHVRPLPAQEAFFDTPALADLLRTGVTTTDGLRRLVQANLARGVDWIKVLATERAGTPDTDPRKQVYTEDELRIVVQEAAAKNVPVQAHAHGAEGAHAAVKAGVRSIEHGSYVSDETLHLMASQGTFFVPTIEAVKDVASAGGEYDQTALQLRGQHMLPRLKDAVARASATGVRIAAGSDTGYGPSSLGRLSKEIADLVECGLSPLAALQAGTVTNANMLRREKEIGQIAPGFDADLVVVERNPLESIDTLQDPLLVISNGRVGLDRLNFARPAQRNPQ